MHPIAQAFGQAPEHRHPFPIDGGTGIGQRSGHLGHGGWPSILGLHHHALVARLAIAKARQQGIAIVFGGNHNNAGSVSSQAWLAYEQDC